MLAPGGTGVSTYARSVADAQRRLSSSISVLNDASTSPGARQTGRLLRWTRALSRATAQVRALDGDSLYGHDLYRLAQVHFDIHGRLLDVRPPVTGGIMHWTYPVPLRLLGWHNVYTIHDAIPLTRPDLSPIDPTRHERLLRRIIDAAATLVTVSDAAGDEIAAALAIKRGRIVNCGQPVSPVIDGRLPPGGLSPRAYLLALGSVEPRKNIGSLLEAYAASGVAMPLVIAGPMAGSTSELERAVARTNGVRRMPYVNPDDLGALIAGARALVMPSLAEGFGLPVAEAMALGTPVVTSQAGALAETAGGAALLVDPEDIASIGLALQRIAKDDNLHHRLSLNGLENARRFSPAVFVAALKALYSGLLAAPPHAR